MKLHTTSYEASEQNQTAAESYEQKELLDLVERIKDFRARFGYAPRLDFGDGDRPGQAIPVAKRPEREAPKPELSMDLAAMERRILAAFSNRKPEHKPETQSPFFRQKEAIKLLGCRSTLEKCEKAGWLTATTRRADWSSINDKRSWLQCTGSVKGSILKCPG